MSLFHPFVMTKAVSARDIFFFVLIKQGSIMMMRALFKNVLENSGGAFFSFHICLFDEKKFMLVPAL